MAWIFNAQAAPNTNPWSWEWGSPESFAGLHPCGCPRSHVCRWKTHRISTPPAAPARDDNRAGETKPTFWSVDLYPKGRIQHGKAGDDFLARYYRKHGALDGAWVYIEQNACIEGHDSYFPIPRWATFVSVDVYPRARIEHIFPSDEDA